MDINIKQTKLPIDLHCHSINSDGSHGVTEVLDMVVKNSGKYIALTDHDTVDGVSLAMEYGDKLGLQVFAGVEISVTWVNNSLVHILGLNVDIANVTLLNGLESLRQMRFSRGEKIAAKLAKAGIDNALAGAMQYCKNPKALSRTHFARFLVAEGYATRSNVFNKYLVQGRLGYVPQQWASLEDAVNWITNSGGIAVIAHPCRYKFTRTKLLSLINDFKLAGGSGIEVISSSHTKLEMEAMAVIAKEQGLLASLGSDFHDINAVNPNICLGLNYRLPEICAPIYHKLGITEFD